MTTRNTNAQHPWGRLILFVLFLLVMAAVLKGMGWCIGGVCDVGTNLLFR